MSQNSMLDLGPGSAEPLVLVAWHLPLYSLVCKAVRLWVKASVYLGAEPGWSGTIQFLAFQVYSSPGWQKYPKSKTKCACSGSSIFKRITHCNSPRISRSIHAALRHAVLVPKVCQRHMSLNARNVRSKNRACRSLLAAVHGYSSSAG